MKVLSPRALLSLLLLLGALPAAGRDADAPTRSFDPAKLGLLRTIVPGGDPYGIAFSADGRRLAVGVANGAVLYDTETWREVRRLLGHPNVVLAVAWSPDGRTLAAGGFEGAAVLWDTRTGEIRRTLPGHSSYVGALAFTPDGRSLLTGSHDGSLRLWDAEDGTEKRVLAPAGPAGALSLALSRDGRHAAVGFGNGEVRVWSGEGWATERSFAVGGGSNILAVAMSRDGARVWAATDSSLSGFSLGAVRNETRVETPVNGLGCLALSPDDRFAIVGSNDMTARILDLVRKGEESAKLQHHTGAMAGVAVHPEGRLVATIGHDRHLKIWGRISGGMARVRPKGFCGIRVQADAAGRVVIADVIAGTAAQTAGMRQGDFLLSVGGVQIQNTTDSVDRIGSYLYGDEVEFVVERGGEVKRMTFKLGKRPDDLEN